MTGTAQVVQESNPQDTTDEPDEEDLIDEFSEMMGTREVWDG